MKIYVSGPMTGYPESNYEIFWKHTKKWAEAGHIVFNPGDNFGKRGDLPREEYLKLDITHLLMCDAMALLPGWENSLGAKLELAIARECGIRVFDSETMKPVAWEVDITAKENGDALHPSSPPDEVQLSLGFAD